MLNLIVTIRIRVGMFVTDIVQNHIRFVLTTRCAIAFSQSYSTSIIPIKVNETDK